MIGRLRVVTVLTLLTILFLAWKIDQGDQRADRLEQRLEQQAQQIERLECEQVTQNHAIWPDLPRITLDPASRAAGAWDPCEAQP